MAIGGFIQGCSVDWKESVGKTNSSRHLDSVCVHHIAKNTIQFTRPISLEVVTKKTTGKHLRIFAPDGRNVVALWTDVKDS